MVEGLKLEVAEILEEKNKLMRLLDLERAESAEMKKDLKILADTAEASMEKLQKENDVLKGDVSSIVREDEQKIANLT